MKTSRSKQKWVNKWNFLINEEKRTFFEKSKQLNEQRNAEQTNSKFCKNRLLQKQKTANKMKTARKPNTTSKPNDLVKPCGPGFQQSSDVQNSLAIPAFGSSRTKNCSKDAGDFISPYEFYFSNYFSSFYTQCSENQQLMSKAGQSHNFAENYQRYKMFQHYYQALNRDFIHRNVKNSTNVQRSTSDPHQNEISSPNQQQHIVAPFPSPHPLHTIPSIITTSSQSTKSNASMYPYALKTLKSLSIKLLCKTNV